MAAKSSTDAMKLYDTQYGNVRFPDAFLCHFPPTFTPIRVTLPTLNPAEAPLESSKPMIKILPITDEEYQYWIPIILGILSILGTTLTGLHLTSHHAIPLASTTPLVIITGGSLLGIGLLAYAYYGHVENQKRESPEFVESHRECLRMQERFKLAHTKFRTFEETEQGRNKKIEYIYFQLQKKEEELQLKDTLIRQIAQIDDSLDYLKNYETKKRALDNEIDEFNQKLTTISDSTKVGASLSKTRQEIESRKEQLLKFPADLGERNQDIIRLTALRNTSQKQLNQRLLVDETKLRAEIDSLKRLLQQLENSKTPFFITSIEKHSEQHRQMLFEESQYLKSRAQAIINAQHINIHSIEESDISHKLTMASEFSEKANLLMLHEICQYYVELVDVHETEYQLVQAELNYQKNLLKIDPIFTKRSLITSLETRLSNESRNLSIYRKLCNYAIALENSTKEAEKAHAKFLQVRHIISMVPDAYVRCVKAEAVAADADVDYTKALLEYYQRHNPQKASTCTRNLEDKQNYANKYIALNKSLESLVAMHEGILIAEKKIRQATANGVEQLIDIGKLFEAKFAYAEMMIQVRKAQAQVIQVQCNLGIKPQRDVDQANTAISKAEGYLTEMRQEMARPSEVCHSLIKQVNDTKLEDRNKLQFLTTDMNLLKTAVLQLKY